MTDNTLPSNQQQIIQQVVNGDQHLRKRKSQLDFRFTDEDDIEDIVQFVNSCHQNQEGPNSEFAFRTSGDTISVDEVPIHFVFICSCNLIKT